MTKKHGQKVHNLLVGELSALCRKWSGTHVVLSLTVNKYNDDCVLVHLPNLTQHQKELIAQSLVGIAQNLVGLHNEGEEWKPDDWDDNNGGLGVAG